MTTWQSDIERRALDWEKRRLDNELRPVVPLPDKLKARKHEYELAEARRRRSERAVNLLIGAWAAICAVALAVLILWGVSR